VARIGQKGECHYNRPRRDELNESVLGGKMLLTRPWDKKRRTRGGNLGEGRAVTSTKEVTRVRGKVLEKQTDQAEPKWCILRGSKDSGTRDSLC